MAYRVSALTEYDVQEPDGWLWRWFLRDRAHATDSGVFIDPDRYETEVPYARSVEELEFVRQISAAPDERDLFRSTAIWDYRLLSNCPLPIYDQFSTRDTRRPFYESRAERKRRHCNGLLVPFHAGEVSAISRSTAERIFPIPPSYLKELEVPVHFYAQMPPTIHYYGLFMCGVRVDHLLWRSYVTLWGQAVAGELLSECELAEGAKLWWLPEPFVQGIRSLDVLRVCNGQRARAHNLNSALGWIRRIRWPEIGGPFTVPICNGYGSPCFPIA